MSDRRPLLTAALLLGGLLMIGCTQSAAPTPTPAAIVLPTEAAAASLPGSDADPTAVPTAATVRSEKPAGPTATPTIPPADSVPTATPSPPAVPTVRRLTTGTCCTDHEWINADTIRFIDRRDGRTGWYTLDVIDPAATPVLQSDRLGITSPTGRYLAYPDPATGLAVVEDRETGRVERLNLNRSRPIFTPDGERILWGENDDGVPYERRTTTYWIVGVDRSNLRRLATVTSGSPAAWLGENSLLLSRRDPGDDTTTIFSRLDFETDPAVLTDLWTAPEARSLTVNPAGTTAVYLTTFNPDPDQNGLWQIDLTAETPMPQPLSWLGAYRWLDNEHLVYTPYDLEAEGHDFYRYDLTTEETEPLVIGATVNGRRLRIANNDWSVSPDGTRLVFLAGTGRGVDGLWVLPLPTENGR